MASDTVGNFLLGHGNHDLGIQPTPDFVAHFGNHLLRAEVEKIPSADLELDELFQPLFFSHRPSPPLDLYF